MDLLRYFRGTGTEKCVYARCIRTPDGKKASSKGKYSTGDIIERDSEGCGDWFKGKIINGPTDDDQYDIEYDLVYDNGDCMKIIEGISNKEILDTKVEVTSTSSIYYPR
jgi:hypothetical protein